MELTLPPGRSDAQFQAALRAFEGVVGADWVLATDLDRTTYSDIYAVGPETANPPSAAVAPASVEEVRGIVRLANQHLIPLWPISRGKNLGYGTAAPRLRRCRWRWAPGPAGRVHGSRLPPGRLE